MIEVLNLPKGDIFEVCPELKEVKCMIDFSKNNEGLPIRETITYVILLYTKDSFINKKPIDPLSIRANRAAGLSGLDPESELFIKQFFELGNETVRNLIVEYLVHQNFSKWSNRCAIDAQMAENLRIRFKPIENEKADKDILNKFLLTNHYTEYENQVKKLDADIFQDHNSIRDSAVKKKTSLESLIK